MPKQFEKCELCHNNLPLYVDGPKICNVCAVSLSFSILYELPKIGDIYKYKELFDGKLAFIKVTKVSSYKIHFKLLDKKQEYSTSVSKFKQYFLLATKEDLENKNMFVAVRKIQL